MCLCLSSQKHFTTFVDLLNNQHPIKIIIKSKPFLSSISYAYRSLRRSQKLLFNKFLRFTPISKLLRLSVVEFPETKRCNYLQHLNEIFQIAASPKYTHRSLSSKDICLPDCDSEYIDESV